MTHKQSLACLVLSVVVGVAGYLGWRSDLEVAPAPAHTAPVPSLPKPPEAAVTVEPVVKQQRTAAASPTREERRASWQSNAQVIQQELIAALLSGDAALIEQAQAKARTLAAASAGR